jgi:ATP-dependent Lon protease
VQVTQGKNMSDIISNSASSDLSSYDTTERSLPILPVRDTVLFPHAVLPLTVGRESSVQLINSLGEDKTIVVVAQREARVDSPQPTDLYSVGTLAVVHKVVKMPNQSLFVFAEGLERVRLADFAQLTPFMRARVTTIAEIIPPKDSEIEALQRNVLTLFQQIVAGSPTLSDELSTVAMNIEEPGRLVDFIASSLPSLSTSDKQETLETTDVRIRLEKINQHLAKELEVQQLRNKIQSEVQDRVQQTQREYYLREQMKAIQKELGEQDEGAARHRGTETEDRIGRHARRSEEGSAERTRTAGTHVADGGRLFGHAKLHRVAGGVCRGRRRRVGRSKS